MHTTDLGVVSAESGRMVLISEEACRDIAKRLNTSSEALIEEHEAVLVDFHGPVNLGVDAVEAVYQNGLVCPAVVIGLGEGFVRFRKSDEPSFAEYSSGHRLSTGSLKAGDPFFQTIAVEYADKMLGRVTRINNALDEALGVVERRGVYGEVL